MLTEEKAVIRTTIEHVCGTCGEARGDENLPANKLICREGYGIKHIENKGCPAWRVNDTALIE